MARAEHQKLIGDTVLTARPHSGGVQLSRRRGCQAALGQVQIEMLCSAWTSTQLTPSALGGTVEAAHQPI